MTRLVFLLATLSLATSCASIIRGSTETFAIETSPAGATVSVQHAGGVEACTSPCAVEVKRKGALHVTITKAGYKEHRASVESILDKAGKASVAGNLLLGSDLWGVGVDAQTGALHAHQPNPLVVELEPREPK